MAGQDQDKTKTNALLLDKIPEKIYAIQLQIQTDKTHMRQQSRPSSRIDMSEPKWV